MLKRLDLLSESGYGIPGADALFLSAFFASLFDVLDDPKCMTEVFATRTMTEKLEGGGKNGEDDGDAEEVKRDHNDLREGISLFLLQYLKPSPKNVKGSVFRANLSAAIKSCESKASGDDFDF